MFRLTLQLAQSADVESVLVDLDYFDARNNYHQAASFLLRSGDPPVVWEFPLRDSSHRTYRRRLRFVHPAGCETTSAWEEKSLDDGTLLVGAPSRATRDDAYAEALDRFLSGGSRREATGDLVHFTVAAASALVPGSVSELSLWAHTDAQRQEVLQRIGAAIPGESVIKSKGPVSLPRGSRLTVMAAIDGLPVEPVEEDLLWAGDIATTTFLVTVPDAVPPGARSGRITIKTNGLQIARVHFTVAVGPSRGKRIPLPSTEELHRTAFASYASADRDEVLRSIQGMQKVAPQLDIFLDVLTLRSGEDWEQRLWMVIPKSDVFYLFWSSHARESAWVEKEWRCALQSRGGDFIDPVPLESPETAPPPAELASKHFNDWTLAFRRRGLS
jgi:hypothetical protein